MHADYLSVNYAVNKSGCKYTNENVSSFLY